jgi:hypothetical protein
MERNRRQRFKESFLLQNDLEKARSRLGEIRGPSGVAGV